MRYERKKNDDFKIYPSCDMLVDQDMVIGGDWCGHKCLNRAEYEIGGYFLCSECVQMLEKEPWRITFPPHGTADNWCENAQRIVESMMERTEQCK